MAETFEWIRRPKAAEKIFLLIGDHGEAAQAASLIVDLPCAVALIPCSDWNTNLSPWPAQPVFGKEGFGGGAELFLKHLLEECLPEIERETLELSGKVYPQFALCGYSLAGLFALWTVMHCNRFQYVASVSGSLWFDGFEEWFHSHESQLAVERAYFSVGDKEKRTRNSRMADVEAATNRIAHRTAQLGISSTFVLNPGNHFQNVPQRLADAIKWLIQKG